MIYLPKPIKIIYSRYLVRRMAHQPGALSVVIKVMQVVPAGCVPIRAPLLTRRLMLIITTSSTWVIAAALVGASFGVPHSLLLIPGFFAWVFGTLVYRARFEIKFSVMAV